MLLRRIGLSLLMVVLTISMIFVLLRVSPHNPAFTALQGLMAKGIPYSIASERVKIEYNINFSTPLYVQYLTYLWQLLHGNLGHSYLFPTTPIALVVLHALPWTVFSVGIALVMMFVSGVAMGAIAAFNRQGWFDKIISPVSSILSGLPNYITGTILLYFFAALLGWFPLTGAYGTGTVPGLNFPFIFSALYHVVLPAGAYAISGFGYYVLMMRSNTVSTLNEDFVVGARARGIPRERIMSRYVAPNSILPMVTHVVLALAGMLGGSVFVEAIFSYPGVGQLFGLAAGAYDYPLMQAEFLFLSSTVIFANLLADLLYMKVDPRIRLEDVA